MKRQLMILCLLCLVAICSSAQEKYAVKGIANKELNEKQLFLCLLDDGVKTNEVILDSATVKKGKFSFSGMVRMPRIAIIKDMDGKFYPLVLEKGSILLNIEKNERRGTPLNDTLNIAINQMKPTMDSLMRMDEEVRTELQGLKDGGLEKMKNDTAFNAKIMEYGRKAGLHVESLMKYVNDYKNSMVGTYLFLWGSSMFSLDNIEVLMKGASPVFSQSIIVKDIIEMKKLFQQRVEEEMKKNMSKEQLEDRNKKREMDAKIKIGERFPDAKVKDNAGNMKLLSDYVGKGKYVLIDFWASWCGPCRHEMPNVKAAYEKYASKGFEVISISTDRKLKPWRDAIEELGMIWTQLLDVDAAETYGVSYIPTTYLIDPDGTIIEKNLRGEKLEKVLSELFK
ncbi:redoxin domain-containing protein [Bacteroides sp. AN502(2024)]|uniref:redoxin domain-containing protein n=1 Tax=Bacteroides sp. AN502(2024) TaxID=3160599 RepID=UPI003518EBD7